MSAPPGASDAAAVALPQYMMQPPQSKLKVVAGYALQQKLGSGSFAVVYKGVRLQPTGGKDDCSAIKAIDRTSEKLTKKVLQNLEVEISILRTYRHRNIVCMHDVQKTANHFYLILEYCAGGDVQGLIRSRRDRRLSEGLTRRLMRDLAHGLAFLWKQQLIHRDIKPQNLLLTGPLPLDEVHDPEQSFELEERRRRSNFSTNDFCLKIADFGFARHLQSTSLAETLCGSPLYMAPEILQHHSYDAKADLWSVGTVLFEMISGEPPFHGENHIDLLRNIQRKAVRLPKDVRVSKECVNLLRLLLSRNPLTRAGFKEFFEACDSLVALGCNGVATVDEGSCRRPSLDLGTIPEYPLPTPSITDSVMTVVTNSAVQLSPSGPSTTLTVVPARDTFTKQPGSPYTTFSPLVPSPPTSSGVSMTNHAMTELAIIGNSKRMPQAIEMPTRRHETEVNSGGLHNSSDESSFVMVEHGTSSQHHVSNAVTEPPVSTAVVSHYNESYRRQTQQHDSNRLEQSPPSSPKFFFNKVPVLSSRGDYMVVKSPKGMLSTSPGTGGALMSMLTRRPQLTAVAAGSSPTNRDDGSNKLEMRINAAAKMLAAAEDVGRRAICVAHLGDRRAYAAMRLFSVNESSSSSVASVTPMDGIMEESAEHDSGEVTDDSSSTEIMASARRRRSSVSVADKSMADMKLDDEGEDEMPFAVQSESTPVLTAEFSTRSNSSSIIAIKDSNAMGSHRIEKPVPNMIQSHFSEALSCYLKALKMLQGAIGATESVMREWNSLSSENGTTEQGMYSAHLKQRSEVILNWLGNQFKGVLERGNAANTEIAKLPSSQNSANQSSLSSVEELLYHHSLGYGREGAVKQLLGHYEAARFCYRSAGLLAETLLMEPKIENDDRKTLESFVDGFAMQITEIDELIMQQSQHRLTASNIASSHASVRRGPSVVGLVGNPFATCSGAK